MIGSEKKDDPDPETMTSVELHNHFTQLVGNHVQDVEKRHTDTMERIDGLETSFTQQLDTRFQEMMARLPAPNQLLPSRPLPSHSSTGVFGVSHATGLMPLQVLLS
jgi:hypothetical protein